MVLLYPVVSLPTRDRAGGSSGVELMRPTDCGSDSLDEETFSPSIVIVQCRQQLSLRAQVVVGPSQQTADTRHCRGHRVACCCHNNSCDQWISRT